MAEKKQLPTKKQLPAKKQSTAAKQPPAKKQSPAGKQSPAKKQSPVERRPPAKEQPPRKKQDKQGIAETPEERYLKVQAAAYYLAENDGFSRDPVEYWTAAEASEGRS